MQKSIFLIGYRATGKTSVGQRLATRLGLTFLDLDQELEERQGRTIAQLVAARGWPHFRALEAELLGEVSGRGGLVVSTGGGSVLHGELWPAIRAAHLVVWLTAEATTIGQRLLADPLTVSQRPSLTGGDLVREVGEVLAQRQPLYRAACHLSLDTGRLTIDEVVDQVAAAAREAGVTGP